MEIAKILILLPIICSSKPLNELREHAPTIDIPLVTFDGKESTTFDFHELNDPVMVRTLHLFCPRIKLIMCYVKLIFMFVYV